MFTHLKLCLATASHNFKWMKITDNCLTYDQAIANLDVQTRILMFNNSDFIGS